MSLEERLRKERPGKRVLSIQSHVVSGYAGNKCSVFPMQLHGFEVDFINSVQFSNHTGYHYIQGQKLTEKELDELYQGLKKNAINKYSHVLTGYCGNPTFLNKIADIVVELKKNNPDLYFVCDPVLGDNGQYYTPEELMIIYRDRVLPLADVITPNAFELGELSGIEVNNQEECLKAIDQLHLKNPNISIIVVTSGVFSEEKDVMYCFASQKLTSGTIQKYRFTIPVIKGVYVGTGDVFASLLLVWLAELNGDLKTAVGNVISSLQLLLRRTSESAFHQSQTPSAAQRELKLIESRLDLLLPKENAIFVCQL